MKKLLFIFSSLLLISCKSVQPVVSVPRNDSIVIRNNYQHDSIYVRDSIFIREKGDTVFCDRWHDRWQVQRIERTDTLYRDKEVIITPPPERYIPPWAWWALAICIILTALLIIRIILRFYLHR